MSDSMMAVWGALMALNPTTMAVTGKSGEAANRGKMYFHDGTAVYVRKVKKAHLIPERPVKDYDEEDE